MQHTLKKILSNLWVVQVRSISFQEISYAGKPQVVSRYILSNLWCHTCWLLHPFIILLSAIILNVVILSVVTSVFQPCPSSLPECSCKIRFLKKIEKETLFAAIHILQVSCRFRALEDRIFMHCKNKLIEGTSEKGEQNNFLTKKWSYC